MTHICPPGKKNYRSSVLSLENNYRHANGGAKTLTIKKLKSVYIKITVYDHDHDHFQGHNLDQDLG